MAKHLFRSVCFLAAFFSVSAPLIFAQSITTADVVGTVSDASGAVVPNAKVTIRFVDTQEVRTDTANSQGQFRFPLLRPGNYTISAESPGLKSNIEKFALLLGQEAAMNLTLKPQATQEVIEVTSTASVLQTENANSTTSFNNSQVVDLPMAGGDLTELLTTVPGVRMNVKGGSGTANANGVAGASFLFTLNGFDVMDPYNNLNNSGASNNTLGANEVAEVAVVLNAYSAQYGRMAGGQENMIGKSGTNAFHGNLLYNYNDAIFNANSFFKNYAGTPRGRADSNQYAGSVGGPIIKNKLFFYFDTEGLRYALPSSTNVSIPSPQLQTYALAHIPAAETTLYKDLFAVYNGAPGLNRAVPVTFGNGVTQDSTDPNKAKNGLGCGGLGTFGGTAAPGGGTFGLDVPCAVAFVSANNSLNTEALYIARADYEINGKQKINFRYQFDTGNQATSTSPFNPVFSSVSHQPQHQGQVNHTYIISPNIVNNFIGGASWYSAIFGVADFATANKLLPERFAIADGGAQEGGFTSAGSAIPNGRNVAQLQLIDDLSWTKGRHALKFGVNYRYNKVTATNLSANTVEGLYSFRDLVDFTNGVINSTGKGSAFTQSYAQLAAAHIRAYSFNGYLQDEWAIKPNLKLTYGIRFERDGNPACLDNCFALLNTQFGTAGYQGSASIPYNQTIQTGLHNAYHGLEAVIPEPRFGFAWSPFGSGDKKPIIRGGIGLFANLFAVSVANNIDTNSPSVFSPSVTFGNVNLPTDTTSSAYAAVSAYNAFTNGFKSGYTLAQIQASLGKIAFSAPNYYSPPDNFKAPKYLQWSFEIEQPLTHRDVLAITYSGNHGYDEAISNLDSNLFVLAKNYPNGFQGLPSVAPDPRFLTVTQVLTSGVSNYDGLTVALRHALSHGFMAQGSYTWSHSLGTSGVFNPNSIDAGYGPLSFDQRHTVSGDVLWNSPSRYGNHFLNQVLGGWTLGGKFFVYSGVPFSVTNSAMAARVNSGVTSQNTYISDVLSPGVTGIQCGSDNIATQNGVHCLTQSQFATSLTQLDYGNVAPNQFRGAGYFDIDSQITKNFTVMEKYKLGIGAQFYNLLNHPNFANASGVATSTGIGLATTTVAQPSSIYGSGQGASVSGRFMILVAKFNF